YKRTALHPVQFIPFSAFWLRSSVVSVLISLISDMWANGPHDIKLIFIGGKATTRACSRGFSIVVHALHYCKDWRTPPILVQ
ncbi:unnamed protein product, partial [Linum tenue]